MIFPFYNPYILSTFPILLLGYPHDFGNLHIDPDSIWQYKYNIIYIWYTYIYTYVYIYDIYVYIYTSHIYIYHIYIYIIYIYHIYIYIYDMIWYDMIWYDMIYICVICICIYVYIYICPILVGFEEPFFVEARPCSTSAKTCSCHGVNACRSPWMWPRRMAVSPRRIPFAALEKEGFPAKYGD